MFACSATASPFVSGREGSPCTPFIGAYDLRRGAVDVVVETLGSRRSVDEGAPDGWLRVRCGREGAREKTFPMVVIAVATRAGPGPRVLAPHVGRHEARPGLEILGVVGS